MPSKCVLLVNVGTPRSYKVGDVRRYLFQFLNDHRVIDLPWLLRKFLVNGIIVPFRAPKSAKAYQLLWTENGSPLLYYGNRVTDMLQQQLGNDYKVMLAMNYGDPNIADVLKEIEQAQYDELIIVPLYPQYASATNGSAAERVLDIVRQWYVVPQLRVVGQFYQHPDYIQMFADNARRYNPASYDHVLMSFHGLPMNQVNNTHTRPCNNECEKVFQPYNRFCYKNTCYETARRIAALLGLKPEQYTVCFQSRLDKNWLEPFSDKVIAQKARQGAKRLLVLSPAFVADCLETNVEIGHEYQELFKHNGGETIQLVESLNDNPRWVALLKELVIKV